MHMHVLRVLAAAALIAGTTSATAAAQAPAAPAPEQPAPAPAAPQAQTPAANPNAPFTSACGFSVPPPAVQPPQNIGPIVYFVEFCFPKQTGSFIDRETYQYYIKFRGSLPSQGVWIPYNDAAEQAVREDFRRVWDQGFLEDFVIEANDYAFANGVQGKIISYKLEERERIKIVTYEGSKQIDRTKIEEELRNRSIVIAVDSLIDEQKIQRVEGVVRDLMLEKGFNAQVTHTIAPVEGSSKTVNLTFHVDEGPKVKIKKVDFVGNAAYSDGKLERQMKENKPKGILSWITGTGTYNAAKFEEDAARVEDYYQNHGYPNIRVGQPELKVVENTKDGKTQWIELRIPVTEGGKYQFGELDFTGNNRLPSDVLRTLYELKPGDLYNRKKIVEGNKKAQEVYGGWGYMEFTPAPELTRSDQVPDPAVQLASLVPEALAPVTEQKPAAPAKQPTVDVTIHITEGEQFFINRIVFKGNTTTRDNVIRRELGGLAEGAPFNTNALKNAVRRLNQLGYFQPIEGDERDTTVDKTPGKPNRVDVTMKLAEQNRNQLTFGAGISQYEGFFGQLAFSTANFLGRGESLTVSLQGGERAQNYQLGFTEPFLFDRNITGGIDLHKRSLQYVGYYTQKSTGGNLFVGFPVRPFTRMFMNYSYEEVHITDLNEALIDSSCVFSSSGCSTIQSVADLSQLTPTQIETIGRNQFLMDSLLVGQGGKRTISKVVPSIIHNTVNHPIFPTFGKKLTASVDLAVLGGNTQFYKPHLEGIWFIRHTSRTTIGLRGLFDYITPVGRTTSLPIFERLFLGGEYSVRGFDIRSIGPTAEGSPVVLGGNKSLLFNAEYQISIAQPVRLVLFYDAGQVRNFGEKFVWQEDLTRNVFPPPPALLPPFPDAVRDPDAPGPTLEVIGKTSAFKTSTGVELRFFMPVLNVPFRLIYAFNPQRGGVLDNNLQPAKDQTFRFAVGTTF